MSTEHNIEREKTSLLVKKKREKEFSILEVLALVLTYYFFDTRAVLGTNGANLI